MLLNSLPSPVVMTGGLLKTNDCSGLEVLEHDTLTNSVLPCRVFDMTIAVI